MKLFGIICLIVLTGMSPICVLGQRTIQGRVLDETAQEPVAGATIFFNDSTEFSVCDNAGRFQLRNFKSGKISVSATGFVTSYLDPGNKDQLIVYLSPGIKELSDVVISGTLKAIKRTESPVAIEVYTPQFFKKNPNPSLFESLQNINGVRPQLNCSVCNTGDIHINGLEGPYTMVTIDGMPIVSSLASVYGLFGIPSQLIERIEIVKGPASGLYGSEAIGGLINIITKSPEKSSRFSVNILTTSWREHNVDLGFRFKVGLKATSLLGINYFNYSHPMDNNKDGFTDVTLQRRVSVFNKWNFKRANNRTATIAARLFYEDRWGGEMNWNKGFRGGDSVYGESIYTKRWELIGNYQLPVSEKIFASFSATHHNQDSWYGKIPYKGDQLIGFGQLIWDKQLSGAHNLLTGLAVRYNSYDDNSTATRDTIMGKTKPDKTIVPGVFLQDEWKVNNSNTVLIGIRTDFHPVHKLIFTPRLAWKASLKNHQVVRINAGTGFRVVSLFTEEHAALTGARAVEILESLKPERSYNVNLNYTRNFRFAKSSFNVDAAAWYSYFTNQITADYDSDPNKIIYQNLRGFSLSKGVTLNLEYNRGHRLKALAGVTFQDVEKVTRDASGKKIQQRPVLTESWSGTWSISYTFPSAGWTIDYTGNVYGPMRLPLLSPLDPRPEHSPVWSLQNIQFTKKVAGQIEVFAGIKNLLNWTPAKNVPFIIARSHDPFDKQVSYDSNGKVHSTPENPYGLTFDPTYVFAPNQGLRVFGGLRFNVK